MLTSAFACLSRIAIDLRRESRIFTVDWRMIGLTQTRACVISCVFTANGRPDRPTLDVMAVLPLTVRLCQVYVLCHSIVGHQGYPWNSARNVYYAVVIHIISTMLSMWLVQWLLLWAVFVMCLTWTTLKVHIEQWESLPKCALSKVPHPCGPWTCPQYKIQRRPVMLTQALDTSDLQFRNFR